MSVFLYAAVHIVLIPFRADTYLLMAFKKNPNQMNPLYLRNSITPKYISII